MFTFRSLLGGEVYDLPSAANVTMGFELSDVSGATIKYAINGVNADKVVEDATIIAYYNGTEIKGGRWWLQGTTGEEVVEDVLYKTIAGKNLFTIFSKSVVHTGSSDGKKAYTARTPGYILNDLFTAAQARGAMTGITWDFTATLDSEGQAWPDAYDISYSITDSYLKIIQSMFDNAWAEFGFNGTVFQATKPFQYGTDLSSTVELIAGRDYLELPYKTSIEDRIHYALVAGDGGSQANYYAAGSTGPYGREEAGATQGGVQGATLSIFAFNMVRDNNKNSRENTRKVIVGGQTPVPGVAFNVGDTVTERITVTPISSRVRAMALQVDQHGQATASIVVGDRILDADIAAARARNALSGSVRSTGGTGTVTPPPSGTVADTNTPTAPTALAGFTDGYLDTNGLFRAYVSLTWTPPTVNTDASTLNDLSGYEVQWKIGTGWSNNWAATRVNDPTIVIGGLDAGATYQFRVRALDNASPPHLSAFTSTLTTVTATDNIAPPTPKAPTAITSRGQAIISWNGKSSADASMGVDFSHVDVHRSQTNNFTPDTTSAFATRVGQMSGPGSIIFADQAYGVTWYYKLVAYDWTGNVSAAASTQVSATTAQLVSGDLAVGVAGNKITVAGTAPSSPTTGDQWIDTANGNVIKIWDGSAWVNRQDAAIGTAQTAANTAQTTANGKNKVTYSASTPGSTANTAGDIWFQQTGNQIIGQWVGAGGTSWTATTLRNEVIATLDAAKITTGTLDAARIATGSLTVGQVGGLQTALDAKATTYYQSGIPTAAVAGDLWVDSDNLLMYRAAVAGADAITSGEWELVTSATTGLQTFYQTTAPPTANDGDLWFDSDNNNKQYMWRTPTLGASNRTNMSTNPSAEAATTNVTAVGCTLSRPTTWAADRVSSFGLTPNISTTGTYVSLGGDTGGLRLGMVAGGTYTVSATGYIPVTLTGSSETVRSRRIVVFHKIPADAGYTILTSSPLTNAPVVGGERVSVTFTLPAGTTEAFIRLYNGWTNTATNIVHWDAILLEQSSTLNPYFDGSDPDCAWTGTADVSTSTYTAFTAGWFPVDSPAGSTTFAQNGIPTSVAIGDLWIDTDDNNKMYRAAAVGATTIAAGQWVLVDPTIVTSTTFAQTSIPASLNAGDLWVDTDDGNKLYRAAVAGATTIAAGQWVVVDSSTKTFAQTSIPTSVTIGDLWIDTDDANKLYRAAAVGATTIAAGQWVAVPPVTSTTFAQTAIPTSLNIGDMWVDTDDSNKLYRAAAAGATTIAAGQWVLVTPLSAKTFAQTGIPTSTMIGDLWIDTDDANKLYRAAAVGATTIAAGQWEVYAPVTTKTFAQTGIPTSVTIGDLWIDTDDGNKIYRAAAAGATTIAAGQWVLMDNTNFQAATTLVNGWKFTGQTTINGGMIQADTILAAQIAAGQITSSELAAGSVIAGKVAADVITTNELAANAVEADNILAGAVTALKVTADVVDGKTITGSTLRTAAAGKRVEIVGGSETVPNEIRYFAGDGSMTRMHGLELGSGWSQGVEIQGPQVPYNAGGNVWNSIAKFQADGGLILGGVYGDPASLDSGGWLNEGSYIELGLSGTSPNQQGYMVGECPSWYFEYYATAGGTAGSFAMGIGGLEASNMRPIEYNYATTSVVTTTSTSPTSCGNAGGSGTFKGPKSGCVLVYVTAHCKIATAGQAVFVSYQLRTGSTVGSGTLIQDHDEDNSVLTFDTQYIRATVVSKVTGLTDGADYNIRQVFSSGAGATASVVRGNLLVVPQL